jgi:glycosyltransferase involved in cell wall biosynthesis
MHESTGLLVAPGRPDLLADELRRVILDPDLGQRLGRAGRQRVESEFSLERMLEAKSDLYRALSGR